jgi:hypothetical protein
MSFKFTGSVIKEDSRLVLPSTNAVANLGQLAADLLIKNHSLERIISFNGSLIKYAFADGKFKLLGKNVRYLHYENKKSYRV